MHTCVTVAVRNPATKAPFLACAFRFDFGYHLAPTVWNRLCLSLNSQCDIYGNLCCHLSNECKAVCVGLVEVNTHWQFSTATVIKYQVFWAVFVTCFYRCFALYVAFVVPCNLQRPTVCSTKRPILGRLLGQKSADIKYFWHTSSSENLVPKK